MSWEEVAEVGGLEVVEEADSRIRALCLTGGAVVVSDSVPVERYWRSGGELLRMANIYREEKAIDKAFILYTKYITLFVEKLPKHVDYARSDASRKTTVKAKCKQIFPIAEQLKSQLLAKYQREYDSYLARKRLKESEENERLKKLSSRDVRNNLSETQSDNILELQQKLDQQIKELKDKRVEDIVPVVDRSTKPSLLSLNDELDASLRNVIISSKLVDTFLAIAKANSDNNVETCAILAGRLSHNAFTVTHVVVPSQRGTADSCLTDNEEQVFLILDKYDLITIGWIHTHPSQNSFMSSIDLHTHCSYQLMLPEAIAIVCAPKFSEVGTFSLTCSHGLNYIAKCQQTGFHLHPNNPPLYESAKHVVYDHTIPVQLVDLR